MSELTEWDSFYVIVGSAAGALIGLQFVVMTLIAERPPRGAKEAAAAFATPTIVHFSTVFPVGDSARSLARHHARGSSLGSRRHWWAWYTGIVARRMRSQSSYKPEFEDWSFHCVLPFAAYAGLAAIAFATTSHLRAALFGFGAAMLLLLFSAIHNSWDAVAYHVLMNLRNEKD